MNDEETTIKDTEITDDFSTALESTPEEVRDFMWSEAFKIILEAIKSTYGLNDQQIDIVKNVAIETLIGTTTPVSRQIKLSGAGITGELQDKVLEAINDEIVSRALGQIQLYEELNEDDDNENTESPVTTIDAPSPAQAIASIQDRLTKPSTVAPITRDYSLAKQTPTPEAEQLPRQQIIDIYREIPDK